MLGLLVGACLCFSSNPSPAEIAAFKAAYQSRKYETPNETPDPGISKALIILINADRKGQDIGSFQEAIAKPADQSYYSDYSSVFLTKHTVGNLRFSVARMGYVTRMVAYQGNTELKLPADYRWHYRFDPEPIALPSGLILSKEYSIQDAGTRMTIRLVWLKHVGNQLRKLDSFEGTFELDQPEVKINKNRITVTTVDEFKVFTVCAADHEPERMTVWDCSTGTPRLVQKVLRHKELRTVDAAIDHAYRTQKPTAQDRLIRKRLPEGEMIDSWTVKKGTNGRARVTVWDALVFHLKKTKSGFKVESVSPVKVSTAKHRS